MSALKPVLPEGTIVRWRGDTSAACDVRCHHTIGRLGRIVLDWGIYDMPQQAGPPRACVVYALQWLDGADAGGGYAVLDCEIEPVRYPSWCCPRCGARVGYLGRVIAWCGIGHQCIPKEQEGA